jgi:hypothetical protein
VLVSAESQLAVSYPCCSLFSDSWLCHICAAFSLAKAGRVIRAAICLATVGRVLTVLRYV